MKTSVSRIAAVTTIVFALGLVAPVAAYAGSSGQSSTSKSTLTPQQQYVKSEKVINRTFQLSIAVAKAALRTALYNAKSPGARTTARIQFSLAVITASTERDAELVQLGAPPSDSSGSNGGSGSGSGSNGTSGAFGGGDH